MRQIGEEGGQSHRFGGRVNPARIQSADVEQGTDQPIGSADRAVYPTRKHLGVRLGIARQGCGEKPRGVQWLEQIMTGSGKKPRFVAGRLCQLAVCCAERGGALGNPLLQLRQCAFQLFAHLSLIADVGEAGDIAAAGHRPTHSLDHPAILALPLEAVWLAAPPVVQALVDMVLNILRAEIAQPRVVADEVRNRCADVDQPRRIAENFEILAVPGHQVHLGIDNADPGIDMLKGRRQQFARKAQRLAALAKQPRDVGEAHLASRQRRCH